MLSERLGLGPRVVAGLGQVFERWDGRGRPTICGVRRIAWPVRVSQLAGDIELGARTLGLDAARGAAAQARRQGTRPPAGEAVREGDRRRWSPRSRAARPGRRCSTPSRATPAPRRRAAGGGLARDGRVRRHEVGLHPRTFGRGGRPGPAAAASAWGWAPTSVRAARHAGHLHDLGRVGRVRLRLGQGRPAQRTPSARTRAPAQLLHRTDPDPAGRPGRRHRRGQSGARTPRRQRVSPAPERAGAAGSRPRAGGGRRLPGADLDAPAAAPRSPRTPPRPSCAARPSRASSTPKRSRRCWPAPATSPAGAARCPPGSAAARWRCCSWWRAG